jgi:hypothetical protein
MQTVSFDKHGISESCPVHSTITSEECFRCEHFQEHSGFEVQCTFGKSLNERRECESSSLSHMW